jgi:hypothetical protein
MKFTKRSQRGFALILVLLIGALMMIPVLMLLSAVAPRRASVTGEAASDIALASADGVVDKIATQINGFPALLSSLSSDSYIALNIGKMTDKAQMARFTIGYLLSSYLNGHQDTTYSSYQNYMQYYSQLNATQGSLELATIQDSVSTYLYDTTTGKYYVVCDPSGYIASVGNVVGASGDVASKPIGDLATVTAAGSMAVVSHTEVPSAGIGDIDSYWLMDNRWIEIDTNTQFDDARINDDPHSRFIIRATAYPLSGNKDIGGRMRTVQAEVFLGHVKVVPGGWPAVFSDPLWSGGNLTMNSGGIVAGNIYAKGTISLPSGGTIIGDVQADGTGTSSLKSPLSITGNVFGAGPIYVPDGCNITGNIRTGNYVQFDSPSISYVGGYIQATTSVNTKSATLLSNGHSGTLSPPLPNSVSGYTGVAYQAPAVPPMPSFDFAGAFNTAIRTASLYPGATVGGALPYFTLGNVSSSSDVTLNLPPVAGSAVAWYVVGNVDIRGNVTLNFTSPCTIFVGGTFHCNNLIITGHGTIIANVVDVQGPIGRPAGDTQSNVAIIVKTSDQTTFSNPVNIPAIIFAPNGSVTLSSGGTISAGSIVAKGDVNAPSRTTISANPPPFLGAGSSISFITSSGSSTAFKRSWKELISGKYTVTPSNFTNGNFPEVDVNGDFSR